MDKVNIHSFQHRGVGIRAVAFALDVLFFVALFWVFIKIFGHTDGEICTSSIQLGTKFTVGDQEFFQGLCGFPALTYLFIGFAYYVLLEWKLGGTFGKLITGLRVVKVDGPPLDFKAALVRNIIRIVDFLPFLYLVGAISIWSSPTKQRLGDRLAKTFVVSRKN